MGVTPKDFAARVAAECEAAAERLLALQAVIGDEVSTDAITVRMLAEVQALDAVHQTLAGLGRVFEELAQGDGRICGSGGISGSAIANARQSSLRRRLEGRPECSPGGEVDLF